MAITGHVAIVNCDEPGCMWHGELIDMTKIDRHLWTDIYVRVELVKLGWRVDETHHYCPKHAKTAACNAPAAVIK